MTNTGYKIIVTDVNKLKVVSESAVIGTEKTNWAISKLMTANCILHGKEAGIAAVQLGMPIRICLVNLKANRALIMLNPEVVSVSDEVGTAREKCLSIPGKSYAVTRPLRVMVEYMDIKGECHVLELEGSDARRVQHEIDHMNGILISTK